MRHPRLAGRLDAVVALEVEVPTVAITMMRERAVTMELRCLQVNPATQSLLH